MKNLILLVGLPRSGKSTWARKSGYPIVNPDSIRLALHGERFIKSFEPEVWTLTRRMVESLFIAGHDTVILDATNISRENRAEWGFTSKWCAHIHWIKTDKEECIKRAKKGDREDLIPIIERMAIDFELPIKERRWIE